VAPGPARQSITTDGSPEVAKGAPDVDEGAQAVPAPVQASQPHPAVAPTRTMAQRLSRLKEKVHSLHGDIEAHGSDKGLERPAL
ncbi:hypothetical protein Tco_0310240, partial [Tanacetum coccineum]